MSASASDRRHLPALLAGAHGGIGRPLIVPGTILPPLTLSRAQTGALSTALGADGATWVEFGADVPRYTGTGRRLLVGGQRTNAVRNPRAEGAVAGTPGTLPAHWSVALPAGVSVEVVGAAVRSGIPGVTLRFFSASAAGGSIVVDPETPTGIAASPSQQWTSSVFAQLVAGTLAGITSFGIGATSRTAGGAALTGNSTSADTLSATFARFARTATASADVTTAAIQPRIVATVTAGAALDATVFLGGAQMEAASNASSLILPPVGTPGASTRGQDFLAAALAGLGIGGDGAGTYLWSGVLPALGTGTVQTLMQVEGGAARWVVQQQGGSAVVAMAAQGAGTLGLGPAAAGAPLKLWLVLDGQGNGRAKRAGGIAVDILAGGNNAGLTTLRLGANAGAPPNAPMFGEIAAVRCVPRVLSDADADGLLAAMP